MLTREYIRRVAKLLEQTGKPRPGFLHDEPANLEGPVLASLERASTPPTSTEKDEGDVAVEYEWGSDGEMRVVLAK